MAYGVYSDRGYREHILERNKNTNKTEVFTQEDQTFTGRKTFLSGVTTSDLEVQTVEVSENLKVKGKDITEIIDYLPNDVSKENKLTTEDFVNSSIATNTAYFRGTFDSVEDLEAYEGEKTDNDYAFVRTADEFGAISFNRYKYNSQSESWEYEYTLNNSSFTSAQWEAINSGITAELVAKIGDGSAIVPSITEAEYEEIPNKKDGQIREITDAPDRLVPFATLNDTLMTATNVLSALKIKSMIDAVKAEIYTRIDAVKAEIDTIRSYSTEETIVGTWIDGKLIYRKVFTDPNNSWSAHDNIIGNITNFKEPTSIKAIAFNDMGLSGWVENNEAGESRCYTYIKSNGEVHFYRNDVRDGTSYPKKVIIEYTKTTD